VCWQEAAAELHRQKEASRRLAVYGSATTSKTTLRPWEARQGTGRRPRTAKHLMRKGMFRMMTVNKMSDTEALTLTKISRSLDIPLHKQRGPDVSSRPDNA
jgi:hypothetical protein